MSLFELRQQYHRNICIHALRISDGVPNIADVSSRASREIALSIAEQIGYATVASAISGQSRGNQFEQVTKSFLEDAFAILYHLRPGKWVFKVSGSISQFEQYKHLAQLRKALKENPDLASSLGVDYLITPDIVVARVPITDDEINHLKTVIDQTHQTAQYTPIRLANNSEVTPILHASISLKWTLRSDRAQNVRTEAAESHPQS